MERERERDGRKMVATANTNTKPPALGQLCRRPLLVLRENDRMRDEMQRGLLREMRLRDLERSTDTVRDILVFYNLILGIFKNQPK